MKFIIDKSKWLRGEKNSRLLRVRDGKLCCIGQVCLQLGVDERVLRGVGTVDSLVDGVRTPDELPADLACLSTLISYQSSGLPIEVGWVMDCYDINDDTHIADEVRQELLAVEFKKAGHEVEFIDHA